MGFFDWLFGDPDAQPTTTQTSAPPAWLTEAGRGLVKSAQTLTKQPYQPYPGPRQAPLDPFFTQAGEAFTAGTAPVTGQDISGLMNPYVSGVLDVAAQDLGRQYAQQRQAQNLAASKAGAFGGSRHGIIEAEGARNYNQLLSNLYTQGYSSAYDRAAAAAAENKARQLQGGQALMGLGGYKQQFAQTGLDIPYADWEKQRQHPYSQLGFMSDILRGVPSSQSTVVSQQIPQPGAFQTMAGFGLAAAPYIWGR